MIDEQPTGADREIERRLRSSFDELEPPERLWSRIRESAENQEGQPIETAALASRASNRPLGRGHWGLAAALTAIMVAGIIASQPAWLDNAIQGGGQALQPAVLADEFATFVASERSLDVSSTDADTLHMWFSTRLEPTPPKPLSNVALPLAGGRLCQIQRRRVAAYMYDFNGTSVSVYVTPLPGGEIPVPDAPTLIHAHKNYTFATWRKAGWQYSAVADLPPDVMAEIAQRLAVTG